MMRSDGELHEYATLCVDEASPVADPSPPF